MMNKYMVIRRKKSIFGNEVDTNVYDTAEEVAIFMLGKNILHYFILKMYVDSDENFTNERLVFLKNSRYDLMISDLEAA